VANEWTLIALAKIIPNIEFISDSKNHASLIEGMRHSRAPKHIFKHNDLDDLKAKLEDVSSRNSVPCVVLESVYSMDGDVSHLKEILNICRLYAAISYVDEVHAVGLYGAHGGGVIEQLGLERDVDIVNGTLGKAFGVQGGYIAADKIIVDAVRSIASGFIFTTSMSPVTCAGALAAVKYLKANNDLRVKHQERAGKLKQLFRDNGIPLLENNTHIVPVMINDAFKAKTISDELLNEYGHYVQAINYPTVDVGTERLRFAPTPFHSDAMMDDLVARLRTLI
jgi:5-aminolevulinate synthase